MVQHATMCDVSEQPSFAKLVTDRREALELSRRKAAELSGVGGTVWGNVERGFERRRGIDPVANPYRPSRITVLKIAKLLGWKAGEALRWAGYDEPDDDGDSDGDAARPSHSVRDDELGRVEQAWPGVPQRQRVLLALLAESMATPVPVLPTQRGDNGISDPLIVHRVTPPQPVRDERGEDVTGS